MTQQIVQLVDKNGNDIFPVSAGNGQVKIGETLSQPTSVEYVDTDNIVDSAVTTTKINDGAVTANKIDFTTLAYGSSRYTSSQNISAGTTTKVVFQENVYTDTDGITYDNGEFTIHKDGFWYISTEVGGHSNGQCTVEIRINNVEYISQRNYSPQVQYISTSGCYKLKAGDIITIMATGTNAWTINSRAKGNINISLVSPIN